MNFVKIIGHPITVICVYLLLIVSGQSFGGFYLIYIILGLPHGVFDSIISIIGLGIMLLGYKIYKLRLHPVKPILYILGNVVMIMGLVFFFRASKGYNDQTFRQFIPFLSFILFGLCVMCNLFISILLLTKQIKRNSRNLKIVI